MAPLFWERPPEVDETKFRTVFATESKSVTKFRARLNISDIWVDWSLLTEKEIEVELYFTPKFWEENYCNWCIPLTIARTPVINTCGESLSFFYPTDHESNRVYIFEIDSDVIGEPIHRDFPPKDHKGGLQLFEENTIGNFFERAQIDLYTLTRLLIPSNNVILF